MKYSDFKSVLNHVLRYAAPSLAAVWLLSKMLDTKRLEGWYDFQDDMHHAAEPYFNYPTGEFAGAAALILVAFGLARFGQPIIGPIAGAALSLLSALYVLVLWIGMTA
ncbi:MAG: hypothetical protein EOP50_11030 [Sphingobacteriales bacterium]|nr:MAG: hypothetical protein EOP50_11030 [Sphingobacteriales bacterium]